MATEETFSCGRASGLFYIGGGVCDVTRDDGGVKAGRPQRGMLQIQRGARRCMLQIRAERARRSAREHVGVPESASECQRTSLNGC